MGFSYYKWSFWGVLGIPPVKETPICFCASQEITSTRIFFKWNSLPPKIKPCIYSASTKTLHQNAMGWSEIPPLQPHWPHPTHFSYADSDHGSRCFTISRVLKGLKAVSAHAIRSSKAAPGFSKLQILWGGGKSWWKISWKYCCHLVSLPLPVYGQNLAKLLGLKLNGLMAIGYKTFS